MSQKIIKSSNLTESYKGDMEEKAAKGILITFNVKCNKLSRGVARGRDARGKKHKWRPFPVSEYLKRVLMCGRSFARKARKKV